MSLVWFIVVLSFYKQKNIVVGWIFFIHLCFAGLVLLGSEEHVFIALLYPVIAMPIYYLSAWLVAKGIRRLKKRFGWFRKLLESGKGDGTKQNWGIFFTKITLILSVIAATVLPIVMWAYIGEDVSNDLDQFPSEILLYFEWISFFCAALTFVSVWSVYSIVFFLYYLFRWAWMTSKE